MKGSVFILLFLTYLVNPVCLTAADPIADEDLSWSAKLRTAYFLPSDEKVRKIYSDGWADYQLEFSKIVFNGNFEIWTSISWSRATGHSLFCGSEEVSRNGSSLCIVPLSLGIQYYFPVPNMDNWRVYLGAGGSVAFVRITDHSEFVEKYRSKNGAFGGIVKSGIQYYFNNGVFLDFFADYAFQNVHFSSRKDNVENFDAHLSGLKAGVGLGLYF